MSSALTRRAAAYLGAVALQIEKKLQRALASASQSRNLLQELFADIALEVDNRAKGELYFAELGWEIDGVSFNYSFTEIIFEEEGVVYGAEDRYGRAYCFYDVLADFFMYWGVSMLGLVLWKSRSEAGESYAPHLQMFEVRFDNLDVILRYSSALVQGAKNVFWTDIHTNARRFSSLFIYLLEEVAFRPERLKTISPQAQRDLFLLLSRFLFFYDTDDQLEIFLKQFPDFPNAILVGGAPDIFVSELANQLQELKVEPVLLHYLSRVKLLQGLEIRVATSRRLKTCLYSFTSPGGPMYPTRDVRHAAWDALDFLFPSYPILCVAVVILLLGKTDQIETVIGVDN
ncbi:hypothetical protein SASPL_119762 [Salvia splendens]|uniref:Uncharacterized protein n=1 Tax=Salvia splendens TaxID=180675 RepID=A0A8X8XPJ5_SALSN|nr:hypothetical protein SASPL_119762 [Salvia splendens]